MREFDLELGRTVVDIVENETGPRQEVPVPTEMCAQESEKVQVVEEPGEVYKGAPQPVLSTDQRQMVANLNQIKHLRKHIAFIPQYTNSHAIIVCRDPAKFPEHVEGEGVIRHWADRFVF